MELETTAEMTAAALAGPDQFDLEVRLLEETDPATFINMTDNGCGNTCEKDTCVTDS